MDITEISVKSALIRSKIPGVEYVINPYVGCGHGCKYCYARFMAKWSHYHKAAKWGTFVEAKANIAGILHEELRRKKKRGAAFLSSVCDPYQPVEARYGLTRACLELLRQFGWGIEILTRSPLVTRDIDLFRSMPDVSVGLSIPTEDDRVREITEPHAPSITSRIGALKHLHEAGVGTWAFIAPMLPLNPGLLYEAIIPYVNYILIDRLNYPKQVEPLFSHNKWGYALTDEYAIETESELLRLFGAKAKNV